MEIEVLNKYAAEKFSSDKPWAAISVSTTSEQWAEIGKENRVDLLQLEFWDIDRQLEEFGIKPGTDEHKRAILFDEDFANRVWDFVFEVKDKVEVLMIHCEAGVARSPAIAAAIEKVFTGSDDKWFKSKVPNRLVFREMLNAANKRGLI